MPNARASIEPSGSPSYLLRVGDLHPAAELALVVITGPNRGPQPAGQLKQTLDRYAGEHGLSLNAAATRLLAQGLHNDHSKDELEQLRTRLEQTTPENDRQQQSQALLSSRKHPHSQFTS